MRNPNVLIFTIMEKLSSDSYHLFRQAKNIKYLIGMQVKTARVKKGLSQMDLAFDLGLDQNYISKIENGKVNISIESLYKICYYLDCYIQLHEKEPEQKKPIKKIIKKEKPFEYVL